MNTRTIFDKLKSRKLWVTIIGIIIGVAMAFGVDGSEYADIAGTVAGAITALGAIVAYISGEAKIDAADAGAKTSTEADTLGSAEENQ